ncbi:MAG TPA: type II secretion system protein [Lacipirellulaceae bacterium]|nr:type II secretion system protein [Lacipirellulaceae bacterium]
MRRQAGFTLIELVVVIMILGILAGVAAPKFFQTSATATDNGVKQSLAIVRDAIEMYAANNGGSLPPCANANGDDFRQALQNFIRGAFPVCPVGTAKNHNVKPVSGVNTNADATPTHGWMYNTTNGTFIVNSTANSSFGVPYSSF